VIPPGRCAPNPGCWAAAQRREWCASPILRLSAVDATLHRTRSDVNPIVSTGTAGATHAWCPAEMTPCIGPRGCPGAVSIAVCRQSQPAVRAPLSCPAAGRDERRAIRAEVRPGSPSGWPGRSSARREDASRAGWASFSSPLPSNRFQNPSDVSLPARLDRSLRCRMLREPQTVTHPGQTRVPVARAAMSVLALPVRSVPCGVFPSSSPVSVADG